MENEKYTIYQYLHYLWAKKSVIIGFTILSLLAGFAYSSFQTKEYVGKATIFTGNAKNDRLSKKPSIEGTYKKILPKELSSTISASIPTNFHVAIEIKGKDKKQVEKGIQDVATQYEKDLETRFNAQYNSKKEYVESLDQKVKLLEKRSELYDQLLVDPNTQKSDVGNYLDEMLKIEENQRNNKANLAKAKNDFAIMEKPEVVSVTTSLGSSNTLRTTALAGALGFQLILIFLVMWKYILNARRELAGKQEGV